MQSKQPEKQHWVYFIHPARPGFFEQASEAEEQAISEHAAYIQGLLTEGKLILAGPSFDPPYYPQGDARALPLEMPAPGIVIFEADSAKEARKIMEDDPAIQAGVFMARLNTFRLAFSR